MIGKTENNVQKVAENLGDASRITIEAFDERQHCDVVHCRSNEEGGLSAVEHIWN